MLSSLSRRSLRVRNTSFCSSCLCNTRPVPDARLHSPNDGETPGDCASYSTTTTSISAETEGANGNNVAAGSPTVLGTPLAAAEERKSAGDPGHIVSPASQPKDALMQFRKSLAATETNISKPKLAEATTESNDGKDEKAIPSSKASKKASKRLQTRKRGVLRGQSEVKPEAAKDENLTAQSTKPEELKKKKNKVPPRPKALNKHAANSTSDSKASATESASSSPLKALLQKNQTLGNKIKKAQKAEIPGGTRGALISLIQTGKLSVAERASVLRHLRSSVVRRPSTKTPAHKFESGAGRRSIGDVMRNGAGTSSSTAKKAIAHTVGPLEARKGSASVHTVKAEDLKLVPCEQAPLNVPNLAYGLERVLFNPGVYQLQDLRSKVFNFDPYLQEIMPVHEFDFSALKQYMTSSRDKTLLSKALSEKKKYTGSTSSMTSALGHFHFLLSQWRQIHADNLSKSFPAPFTSFTALQRGPVAVFLRWKDGVYAIDADKQYDTANILMSLGKSMEKLLTLTTDDFEKYRKRNSDQISEEERNGPEEFHYTTMGDFLMRSQLDAYDPRLPGTGMFDLKTRAVVSVRMDISEYADGRGYEIKERHGEWESYEREYYDMIRAAFLKYSLQVRMGRMDGIFVAFHNTQRIFGFQYISLSEMDYALHGTHNTALGDSEFKLSLNLMNKVLDRAIDKYPEQTLRLHFETRDGESPWMYIFAEPVKEEEVERIQTTNKAMIDEFEQRVLGLVNSDELNEGQKEVEYDDLKTKFKEDMESKSKQELEIALDEAKTNEDDLNAVSEEEQRLVNEMIDSASERGFVEVEDDDNSAIEEALEANIASEVVKEESVAKGPELSEGPGELMEEVLADKTLTDEVLEGEEPQEVQLEESSHVESTFEVSKSVGSASTVDGSTIDEEAKPDVEPATTAANEVENHQAIEDVVAEDTREIYGMMLTIRNKVNGEWVERPGSDFSSTHEWEVDYAISDLSETQGKNMYDKAVERRRKALSPERDESSDWQNAYIGNIRRLNQKGREWRAKQKAEAVGKDVKTLGNITFQWDSQQRSQATGAPESTSSEDRK